MPLKNKDIGTLELPDKRLNFFPKPITYDLKILKKPGFHPYPGRACLFGLSGNPVPGGDGERTARHPGLVCPGVSRRVRQQLCD